MSKHNWLASAFVFLLTVGPSAVCVSTVVKYTPDASTPADDHDLHPYGCTPCEVCLSHDAYVHNVCVGKQGCLESFARLRAKYERQTAEQE